MLKQKSCHLIFGFLCFMGTNFFNSVEAGRNEGEAPECRSLTFESASLNSSNISEGGKMADIYYNGAVRYRLSSNWDPEKGDRIESECGINPIYDDFYGQIGSSLGGLNWNPNHTYNKTGLRRNCTIKIIQKNGASDTCDFSIRMGGIGMCTLQNSKSANGNLKLDWHYSLPVGARPSITCSRNPYKGGFDQNGNTYKNSTNASLETVTEGAKTKSGSIVMDWSLKEIGNLDCKMKVLVPNTGTLGMSSFDLCNSTYQGPSKVCGNGAIETGETCDDGSDNGTPGKCNQTCSEILPADPVCGNGIKETGETCDDGSDNGTPGKCNLQCDNTEPHTCNFTTFPVSVEKNKFTDFAWTSTGNAS